MDSDIQALPHNHARPLLRLALLAIVTNLIIGYFLPDYPMGFIFISLIFIIAILLNLTLLTDHKAEQRTNPLSDQQKHQLKFEVTTYSSVLALLVCSYLLSIPE
ncbi:hypothetical protein ACFVYJ_03910 [Pontibacter sp. JAM-7]|uniref:hypothetical protein n=1 Tax=Pontibacter sp. JAM-7 TaxID=3366581 RepID=UPI003AF5D58F